ncbi:cysteinyl-tRNA synthetase [Mycoplasmopsis mustelae]|uniref:Cysteinyl-tRNA synthetase n=1 Tax=Mycoplasmopsis mustelae TaxID=171289 RepID=A0A4R7UE60_9BACT|nr:class I tRNA ligase family protein [Mycoplasmopsis mustelae]TDV24123.1 cysteinyl-tRNA synthetase [Mycoplasmopsis mustelae]
MLKVYVCGPTVYNDVHIGNLRPILTMDLILKAARNLKIDFFFVHNITDIDDKIIQQAIKNQWSEVEISKKYAQNYLELLKILKVDTISKLEYVTENLDVIENFILKLSKLGHTYQKNGNVYFNVLKNQNNYGIVSNQKISHMIFDEEKSEFKEFAADFVLWKDTNIGVKYPSVFGFGRPGWHTECAALIDKNFNGTEIDIHGGGMDLTFPHHENENIQYWAATNNNITKEWIRNGQINLKGQKMSKSLQNIILAKDFLNQYSGDHLKLIFLLNSLTSSINIDDNLLNNVDVLLARIKKIFFLKHLNNSSSDFDFKQHQQAMQFLYQRQFSHFNKFINDLIKNINLYKNCNDINLLCKIFKDLAFDVADFNYQSHLSTYHQWQSLLQEKNYEQADLLRAELLRLKLI